jgi:SAM-dependent methyltransferase
VKVCPRFKHMDFLEGWRIARVLPLIRGRLLDVGCGFNNLVRSYGAGIGVDVFPWDGVNVLIGDSARLPFDAECFDTVAILAALNHIPNRAEALIEAHRVLHSDGILIVTMIGPRTGELAHTIFHLDEQARDGMRVGEKKGMPRQEILDLLSACGFVVIEEVRFQFGLNQVLVAMKQSGSG